MKNGNGEMVASVANLVTEAILESLPDSIREKVEKAVAGITGDVTRMALAQTDLAKKLDAMQLALDQTNTRCADLTNNLARATTTCDVTLERIEKSVPLLIEGGLRSAVTGEVAKIDGAQTDLTKKVDAMQLLLDEAHARGNDLRNELARATSAYESTLERHSTQIPLLIEGGLRAAVNALPKPADGKDGAPGAAGATGQPGRDAVFTRPIPYVRGRTYSRDSIVQARAGVWIAETETDQAPGDGCSGWALIQDGMEPVRTEFDAKGFAVMVYRSASGREYVIPLGFRPWQYAGLFDTARTYQPNDLLTEDGGIWLALAESAGQRPGTPNTGHLWKLIQKRPKDGRDGHDGKDGRDGKGERGEPGHAGVSVLNVELSAGGLLETTLSDGRVLSLLTPFTTNKRRAAERERPS